MSSDQDRLPGVPHGPGRPGPSGGPEGRAHPVRPPTRPAWVVNVALRREQERRLAQFNDPRWEWARGLVPRRTAVAVWVVLVAATVVWWSWWIHDDGPWRAAHVALLAAAVVVTVPLVWVITLIRTQAIRGLLDLPFDQLTERQRRLRERTDRIAGRWMLGVFLVGALTVLACRGRLDAAGGLPTAVVLLALGLPLQLPTLVAAWIAPDDRALHAARIPSNL